MFGGWLGAFSPFRKPPSGATRKPLDSHGKLCPLCPAFFSKATYVVASLKWQQIQVQDVNPQGLDVFLIIWSRLKSRWNMSQSLKVSKSTVASAELREYNSTSIASCDIAPSWHSIVRGLKQHTNRSRPHEWPVEVDVPIVCTHLGHWRFFLRWNKMVIFHSCYISHYSWKGNYPIYYRWNIP